MSKAGRLADLAGLCPALANLNSSAPAAPQKTGSSFAEECAEGHHGSHMRLIESPREP